MPRSVCIVQARMSSTRLPGKVLKHLAGKTVLAHVLERCAITPNLNEVVVAIPDDPVDDPVVEEARKLGFPIWRGSQLDVLDRYYKTAVAFKADIIQRITSDCPLTDPEINGRVLALFDEFVDYASNNWRFEWPHGLDVEVFSFDWLEMAWREAYLPEHREHVSPFIREHPDLRQAFLPGPKGQAACWRWTLDTPEDFTLMQELFARLPTDQTRFSWRAPAAIMEEFPDLGHINRVHNRSDVSRTSHSAG